MSFTAECLAAALQPPDRRPPPEWAEEHIQIPNSARGTKRFNRSTVPMLNEPLERSVDPAVRRLIILAPTGGGKTTLLDVRAPFGIANSLGSMLYSEQSDADADEYCEERLMPILDACAPVVALKPTGHNARHLLKKNSRVYPHCSLYVGGAGKSNAQRKSVQFVAVDEAWLVKRGMLAEFEKRTHDRWNGQLCALSQGAVQETLEFVPELEEFWQLTDMAEWSMRCPQCETWQPFAFTKETHVYDKMFEADGATLDHMATAATTRRVCSNADCGKAFRDEVTVRRALAESGRYIPTNARALEGHAGRHYEACTLYWIPWRQLTLEWLRAVESLKDGDPTPMIIFVTKRLARTYMLPKREASVVLTAADYNLADYWDGQPIDGELYRFMGVDVQKGHYWALVRAFRADGSSRLLFADQLQTPEMIRITQQRMKVPDRMVFVDRNYLPTEVDNLCVKYDWTAVEGNKAPGYPINIAPRGKPAKYITRYYDDPRDIMATNGGFARRILFSVVKIKDELDRLRDGVTPPWEHGVGTIGDWHKHMVSEFREISKEGRPVFKRYKQRRNDLRWCEAACTLGAIMMDVLRPAASEPVVDEKMEEAQTVQA